MMMYGGVPRTPQYISREHKNANHATDWDGLFQWIEPWLNRNEYSGNGDTRELKMAALRGNDALSTFLRVGDNPLKVYSPLPLWGVGQRTCSHAEILLVTASTDQ